ncbi:unnamed protein product [Diamesa hyperborea]
MSVMESYKFIPNFGTKMSKYDAVNVIVQLALENKPRSVVNSIEVDGCEQETREPLIHLLKEALDDVPFVKSSFVHLTNEEKDKISERKDYYFVIATECVNKINLLDLFEQLFALEGFVVAREKLGCSLKDVELPSSYQMIASYHVDNELLVVLKFNKIIDVNSPIVIKIKTNDEKFEWLDEIKTSMKDKSYKILLADDNPSGILGLVNCLRKEPNGNLISCYFIDDENSPPFNLGNPVYETQYTKGMTMNILKNGHWGTYRYLKTKLELNSQSHFECDPNMSYIVLGNLDFALNFADKLVQRKCRKIVFNLTSTQTPRHGYRLRVLKANDVEIVLNKADTSTKSGCEQIIVEAATLGAVGGIFNLNNVQSNHLAVGIHSKLFQDCLKLRANAYKYLDEISRELCPNLQYFVAFSSVTSGRGLPGQSNNGMANAINERIMEQRHECGLPAKAIQWSLLRADGFIVDNDIYDVLSHESVLETIDGLFVIDDSVVSSLSKVQISS